MKRLWVRISLVISGVVLFVSFGPVLLRGLAIELGILPMSRFDELFPELIEALPPDIMVQARDAFQTEAVTNLTTFIVIGAVVAILAGIGLSRSLTAPLSELEAGAQAIESQDFSYRVPVSGSQELMAVADAFNQMAEQLAMAETVRRNLLADVAHELRNPLHVIRGNLQAILDDVYPLSKGEIARLVDQTRHLTTLVDDLHELAQADAHQLPLQKETTEIGDLVKETALSYRPLMADKKITLKVELLGTLPLIAVDVARMRQVMSNLLINAFRHTAENGEIVVRVFQEQGGLHITVQDTGVGLAPAQLPHVFDRFYRVDSARSRDKGGTGLGLAIVRAIVEAHKGEVTAASAGVGQGSCFTIRLPVI